ncbi:MAG: PEP-CTERM sorting domain-containing protein [Planctomycetaceae bacterium]|nr:PEP-CTERM sorting domain-containing protein [Planctomycetaceae bacterium]
MMNWKRGSAVVVSAAVLLALAGASQAAIIAVPNYDFELGRTPNPQAEVGWYNDTMMNGGNNYSDILTGWNIFSVSTRFVGRWNPADGNYAGATDGDGTPDPAPLSGQAAFMHWGGGGSVSTQYIRSAQSLATIQSGLDYTLTVGVGSAWGTNMNAVSWVQVNLQADGATVATGHYGPPARGTWTDLSVTLTKELIESSQLAGKSLTIELVGRGGPTTHVDFDNVRLVDSSAIPEPATMGLLVLGGVAALLRRRRN